MPSRLPPFLAAITVSASAAFADLGLRFLYVDAKAPAGGDGLSWETAFNDLQDALAVIKDPAFFPEQVYLVNVLISGGTYKPDRGTADRHATFDFSRASAFGFVDFSFSGGWAGRGTPNPNLRNLSRYPTILSGDLAGDDGPDFTNRDDNSECVARLEPKDPTISFDGLTFRGGHRTEIDSGRPYEQAAGIAIVQQSSGPESGVFARPYFKDCVFRSNLALQGSGAAVSVYSKRGVFYGCVFEENVAINGDGGGVADLGFPKSVISWERCVFEDNRALRGGAISSVSGAQIGLSVFARNHAAMEGGAVYNAATLGMSALVRNSAGVRGGAVASKGPNQASFENCTFAENIAPQGQAIAASGQLLRLRMTILWGHGDGTDAVAIENPTSDFYVTNCVLQAGLGAFAITGSGGVPIANNVVTTDPRFIRPSSICAPESTWIDWNYRLGVGSAAESLGMVYASEFDLDGKSRSALLDGDAGAYFVTTRSCAGNLHRMNTVVDDADFVAFCAAYDIGVVPRADPWADLTRDGLVDAADFAAFSVAYDQMICP